VTTRIIPAFYEGIKDLTFEERQETEPKTFSHNTEELAKYRANAEGGWHVGLGPERDLCVCPYCVKKGRTL
jgi:hypothetical protein